jgi:hypothetical protein
MPSRLRSALVVLLIVACQIGLVVGAVALCDMKSQWTRGSSYLFTLKNRPGADSKPGPNPGPNPTRHFELFYRGYPVPWAVYFREGSWNQAADEIEHIEPVPLGRNRVGPVCLLVLSLGLPLILAAEFRRGWARWRGLPWSPRSRGYRSVCATGFAAAGGLMVALLDVTTNPASHLTDAVGDVPFSHAPGRWAMVPDPSATPGTPGLKLPPSVEWLRKERGRLLPVTKGMTAFTHKPEKHEPQWTARTRRTLLGLGIGLLVGCVAFRPWRRGCPPGKLDAHGTSCPPC